MAKYARGKKSYAISDRGGQRVRYTQLKTTWDGLRVAPDEWEPKHPQLTPAKNVIDAQQLFQPRSTGQSQEDVVIYIGYSYDPFVPIQERPPVGCPGHGRSGLIDRIDFEAYPEAVGQAGTGGVGTVAFEGSKDATGVAGTGGVGVEIPVVEVTGVSGGGGAGAVGVEALNLSILESGVAGTGGVGAEVPQVNRAATGVAGTGGTGTVQSGSIIVDQEWGSGTYGSGTWGN
jgi:hypothetical protein